MTRKKSARQKAIELGIEALAHLRRKRYAAGNAAWEMGSRGLDFVEDDHRKYMEYTAAIDEHKAMLKELQEGNENVWTNKTHTGKKREQREGSEVLG